jgi:hypothetical protein
MLTSGAPERFKTALPVLLITKVLEKVPPTFVLLKAVKLPALGN